jgi:hypothetical protein
VTFWVVTVFKSVVFLVFNKISFWEEEEEGGGGGGGGGEKGREEGGGEGRETGS